MGFEVVLVHLKKLELLEVYENSVGYEQKRSQLTQYGTTHSITLGMVIENNSILLVQPTNVGESIRDSTQRFKNSTPRLVPHQVYS